MDMYGQRILLLIPHPDDEIVGAGAAIARARAKGARVYGLYLSHGCIPRRDAWPWARGKAYDRAVALRLEEGRKAAEFLGMTLLNESPTRAARDIWRECNAVEEEIRAAMRQCAPDVLWVPAYEGGNPDHDAANAIAVQLAGSIQAYEFSEYHFQRGRPVSNRFIAPRGDEQNLRLSNEEQAMKQAGLALYASEKGNVSALKTAEESFRPLKPYDYARPPHPGQLWYARFQWVPFRHPRVDFTDPAEVSRAIEDYRQKADSPPLGGGAGGGVKGSDK